MTFGMQMNKTSVASATRGICEHGATDGDDFQSGIVFETCLVFALDSALHC